MKEKKARILGTTPPRDKLELTGTQNYCRSAKLQFSFKYTSGAHFFVYCYYTVSNVSFI